MFTIFDNILQALKLIYLLIWFLEKNFEFLEFSLIKKV